MELVVIQINVNLQVSVVVQINGGIVMVDVLVQPMTKTISLVIIQLIIVMDVIKVDTQVVVLVYGLMQIVWRHMGM